MVTHAAKKWCRERPGPDLVGLKGPVISTFDSYLSGCSVGPFDANAPHADPGKNKGDVPPPPPVATRNSHMPLPQAENRCL